MSRQRRKFWALFLAATMLLTGCHPTQPFYLQEDGDLSHYLDVATDIDYPDVEEASLAEYEQAKRPLTVIHPEFDEIWDLSLQEAVQTALRNSKVARLFPGGVSGAELFGRPLPVPDNVTRAPEAVPTVYDPAIQESNVPGAPEGQGVESALADFDAQLNASVFWERSDRPQNTPAVNIIGTPFVFQQDTGNASFELTKKAAPGTQLAARLGTIYDKNNRGLGIIRGLPSDWFQDIEIEARQPLLRGAGTQINRIGVTVARIRTDIKLTEFEAGVRNMVNDVERAYWDLHLWYRTLEAEKAGRDAAQVTWKRVHALKIEGAKGGEAEKEAQARQQYFRFRARVEEALRDLYKAENRLRYVMGLTATDGRLIRPSDEPTIAESDFDWHDIRAEAVARSVELRQQRWRIKQREIEMIGARNLLLPQVDAVGLYRWLGSGDDLIAANRRGLNFPAPGSLAWDELTGGKFTEWRFGIEMKLPVGFRRELAGVRNAQLRLAREKARHEEMELELLHQLTDAVQEVDAFYALAQTNFNLRVAAEKEVDAVQAAYDHGTVTLDLLLDAQQRRADAEIAYYRSLVQYNVAIAQVHFRKGSLLEYNNIHLAEGPWPDKAYYDALGHARRRDASYYLNYGFTRPGVVSRGPYAQHQAAAGPTAAPPVGVPGEPMEIIEPGLMDTEGDGKAAPPVVAPAVGTADDSASTDATKQGPAIEPARPEKSVLKVSAVKSDSPSADVGDFDWGALGLNVAASETAGGQSPVKQAAHREIEGPAEDEPVANPSTAEADRPSSEWKGVQR